MKYAIKIYLVWIFSLFCIVYSLADANTPVLLEETPTNWRLQNYVPDTPAIYFTSSSCQYGALYFPTNASDQDRDRLWKSVIAAKTNNGKMFVYYTPGTCTIQSFGIDGVLQQPSGSQGPAGPQGPTGPATKTTAICSSAGNNLNADCNCTNKTISRTTSTNSCSVTSDTGSCTAYGATGDNTCVFCMNPSYPKYYGSCCVCGP